MAMLLGTKVGMTRVYDAEGTVIPVTVLQVGPCVVTQVKTPENDGYAAVQIGFGDIKPRNSTIPMIAHDHKAGTTPKRIHREFRVEGEEAAKYPRAGPDGEGSGGAEVRGRDRPLEGQGLPGRHEASQLQGHVRQPRHGAQHRSPGSIGGHASNRGFGGGLRKGKRMAGHMGDERVTVRSLDVVRIDAENGLLLVKGPVPGANRGLVMVRPAVRLNRSKAKKLAEAAK